MTEHGPENGYGTVDSNGTFDTSSGVHRKMDLVAQDIEVHGEVHAVLEDGREVELRLGTTMIDYAANVVAVWDGDNYVRFDPQRIVNWYRPMGVYEGGE